MAGFDNHLIDMMGVLSVDDDHLRVLGLDDNIRTQLCKIENDYESIFSWSIQQLTEFNQSLTMERIHKVQEKLQMIILDMEGKDDEFNFNRFCLQLIAIYDHYMSKRFKESYMGIESIIQFMETCKFDESYKQCIDAYHHIARATNAYIALILKIDSEKLLKDVKSINSFSQAEKAVICAVKAIIFMEYPPKGYDIALELANQACTLNHDEPEWLIIWLNTKKQIRHHHQPYQMPGDDEINVALNLYKTQSKCKFLVSAYKICKEAGYVNNINNNQKESMKFYNLSSDIAKKSIELAKDDTNQLNSQLLYCLHYPRELLPQEILDNAIAKLSDIENSSVHLTLGRYYLTHKKDFENAKMYFSRGKDYGNFDCILLLIKVECLLQTVHEFPYIQTLNEMYDNFPNPTRRVIILIHILIYYIYYENNPKEIMHYLKLYIDQDIKDTIKKLRLMFVRPLLDVDKFLRPNKFLNVLSVNVKKIINNNKWGEEDKTIIENTYDRFNKILQLNIQDNYFNNENKMAVSKNNESWRKQRVDLSKKDFNESHHQKNLSWRKQRDTRHEFGSHLCNRSYKTNNIEDNLKPDFI